MRERIRRGVALRRAQRLGGRELGETEWCPCGDGGRTDRCATCSYLLHGTERERAEHKRLCAEIRAK